MHNDKAGCLGLENTQKELATEKQVRIEADAQLMQNMASLEITIANETINRQEADTALQTAIDNETSVRQESDNALQLVIDAEVVDRKAAIGTLDIAINKEISDRQEADSSLQAAIDGKAALVHAHDDTYYTETEIDSKLNSPLPWCYNYLAEGYSASLQYRRIGAGYFTYTDNTNWSYYSEIELIHHNASGIFERGSIFVSLRGRGSTVGHASVKYQSKNGGIANLSKTKINYKINTTDKRISLEILAYCYTNYTNILFRNSLTRISDMLTNAQSFWTFASNGYFAQASDTMQAGVTSGYTEIPLSVISVDKNGNDITTTYATKTELASKSDTSHTHDDRYYTESEINSKLANYANVYIGSSQPSSSETAKLWVVI